VSDVREFERLRPRLLGIAYRMLGSRAEAEDVVQDAWLRLERAGHVDSVEAFLVTTTTRLAIDQLRSARVRRESYVGPWLPEPLVTDPAAQLAPAPDALVEKAELLSVGLLRVLEQLEPVERAVFLLREAFGYSFAEIAPVVDRTEENCRQIAVRARERVRRDRPKLEPDPAEHGRLLEAFLRATEEGDLDALVGVLADDVVLVPDSGGRVASARNVIQGASPVARFAIGLAKKGRTGAEVRLVLVNGLPGVLVRPPAGDVTLLSLDVEGGVIRAIYIMRNPEKLAGLPG
jgi:RNA polymerase sigma-70 factor (ECF subfamily)